MLASWNLAFATGSRRERVDRNRGTPLVCESRLAVTRFMSTLAVQYCILSNQRRSAHPVPSPSSDSRPRESAPPYHAARAPSDECAISLVPTTFNLVPSPRVLSSSPPPLAYAVGLLYPQYWAALVSSALLHELVEFLKIAKNRHASRSYHNTRDGSDVRVS
jgi:hypothetical protein